MSIISSVYTVKAPAKVNLSLTVINKRSDGFHNLESIFLAVNFGDTLHFEPIPGKNAVKITMKNQTGFHHGDNYNIPMEKNIIFRALSLFRAKTGFDQGFNINVEKRIPFGGGLGGGSSNAASTLLILNKLAGCPLNREALLEMAASLGSDVPFFIHEIPSAKVTGRGEIIEPTEVLPCFLVLVNPGFHSDTAAAFRLLDKSGKLPGTFLEVFEEPEKSVYIGIINDLREMGAENAGLSGAGAACFGVFEEKASAEKTATIMREKWDFVVVTSAL